MRRILDKKFRDNEIITLHKGDIFPDKNDMLIDDFIKLSAEQKQKVKFIRGHFEFGLHKYIPYSSTYITLLRHPVERVISWYYFLKQSKNPNSKAYTEGVLKSKDFNDFIQRGRAGRNSLIRQICTPEEWQSAESPSDKLDIAKENLTRYFKFGILEKFDESLILLKGHFGWQEIPIYFKANVTKDRPSMDELPESTIETILDYFDLDNELFQFAKGIIADKINNAPETFAEELAKLKLIKNLVERGESFVEQNELKKAIENYKIVADIEPYSSDIQNYLGVLHAYTEDLDKALVYFRKAFAISPDNPAIIHNVGTALQKLGFSEEADHFMALIN